jgi:hypothetical protein
MAPAIPFANDILLQAASAQKTTAKVVDTPGLAIPARVGPKSVSHTQKTFQTTQSFQPLVIQHSAKRCIVSCRASSGSILGVHGSTNSPPSLRTETQNQKVFMNSISASLSWSDKLAPK